jgi:hypothetical protein
MKIGIAVAIIALSSSIALPAVAQTSKESYACPMHPEITADKAGKCSKCGMALVKNTTGTENKADKKHVAGKACEGEGCEGKSCEGKGKGCCGKECSKEEASSTGKH